MDSGSSPDPMDLVSHVNRSKTGVSKLQLTIPIVLRARLARASRDHNIPQLALIRTAITAYLTSLEKKYPPEELVPDRQEGGPVAGLGANTTEFGHVPVSPEPLPEPQPEPVTEPEPVKAPRRTRKERS